jgi:hypothetical protein
MKREPLSAIERKLIKAIKRQYRLIESCGNKRDIQSIKMRCQAEGRLDALRATQQALDGSSILLNIMAGE